MWFFTKKGFQISTPCQAQFGLDVHDGALPSSGKLVSFSCYPLVGSPKARRSMACASTFTDSEGVDENKGASPSTRVGWDEMASRRAVYGNPAIMAVCTDAIISPASTANAVKPRMRSVFRSTSDFKNPRVSEMVLARRTWSMGSLNRR